MQNVHLTVFGCSDVGRVRTNNEDAFLVSDLESGARVTTPVVNLDVHDRGILLVVSDGMGGHAAGDVASALVVESLRRSLSDAKADHSSLQRLIDNAVQRANADVREAARTAEKHGMGATLTAVLVHDEDAFVAEVGDSRGYLLRAGRLRQITKDQSFVQMLIDAGVMTREEAQGSLQKNVILQAMGRGDSVQVAIGRLRLRRGDRLLLCCDGISNAVTDGELETLLGGDDLAAACDRMVALANERGGRDNLTAVVALVGGEALSLPSDAESGTPTLEVLQEFTGTADSLRESEPAQRPATNAAPHTPEAPSASPAPAASAKEPARLAMGAAVRLAAAWIILPLFFLATGGSFAWWEAWVYCAILLGPMTLFVIYMTRNDPEFIARRLKLREDEQAQRRILAWGWPSLLAALVVPGLDNRFGWSGPPSAVVVLAMLVAFGGYLTVLRVFLENRWAGRTVETYPEQVVVSTGPYAIVRHPMYAGSIALYLATPVALGSWWGLVPALAFIPIFVFRIRNEEHVLLRGLPGYEDYRRRVRFRLIPFIW